MSHDAHAHGGHGHAADPDAAAAADHGDAVSPRVPPLPKGATITQRITRRLKKADRGLAPLLCLGFVLWTCGTIGSYQGPAPYSGASRSLPSWRGEADNTTVDKPEGFPVNSGPACACRDCRHPLEKNENFRIFWLFNEQPFAEEYFFRDQASFLHAWQETLRRGLQFHAGGRWVVDVRYGEGRSQSPCAAHDCGPHLTAFRCDLHLNPVVRELAKNAPVPEGGRVFRMPDGRLLLTDWEWRPTSPPKRPGSNPSAPNSPPGPTGAVMEPCRCSGEK